MFWFSQLTKTLGIKGGALESIVLAVWISAIWTLKRILVLGLATWVGIYFFGNELVNQEQNGSNSTKIEDSNYR